MPKKKKKSGGGQDLEEVARLMAGASLTDDEKPPTTPIKSPPKSAKSGKSSKSTPQGGRLSALSPASPKVNIPHPIRISRVDTKATKDLRCMPTISMHPNDLKSSGAAAGTAVAVCHFSSEPKLSMESVAFLATAWPSSDNKPGCCTVSSFQPSQYTGRLKDLSESPSSSTPSSPCPSSTPVTPSVTSPSSPFTFSRPQSPATPIRTKPQRAILTSLAQLQGSPVCFLDDLTVRAVTGTVDDTSPFVQSHIRRSLRHCTLLLDTHGCASVTIPYRGASLDLSLSTAGHDSRAVIVTGQTVISLSLEAPGRDGSPQKSEVDPWARIGGLSKEVKQIREAIEMSLHQPQLFHRFNLKPPRGLLLHGPPGTGKTTIARAAAQACGAHVVVLNGGELTSKYVGESEAALVKAFDGAASHAPSLILIDEIDALAPPLSDSTSEFDRRTVATLLALMDNGGPAGGGDSERVVVIAVTNRPHSLEPALRRPGRLDREIEIGVPDETGRFDILKILLQGMSHEVETATMRTLASQTHGFVGADLSLLCSEALINSTKRCLHEGGGDATVTAQDLYKALAVVAPSALREVSVEVPKVRWSDIGGLTELKMKMKEIVELPLTHPEAFQRLGISPPNGVLLYGPPGCSKTLIAKALATEANMNFLAVQGPELLSKWLGESEKALQALFRRARSAAPSIIFFDEVDAIACQRGSGSDSMTSERLLTQMLVEMDGAGSSQAKRVVVVCATNRPDILDDALMRPGRMDRLLYVPPPDVEARREILRIALRKVPHDQQAAERLGEIAQLTDGLSGAETVALVREASLKAVEADPENCTHLTFDHLRAAADHSIANKRITPEMIEFYRAFQNRKKSLN